MKTEIPEQFLIRERERQETIQRAVEAARQVLNDVANQTPDETAYLLYKTGGHLLMLGLETVDRRVFINDLGGMEQVKATFEKVELEPDLKLHPAAKCHCGRRLDHVGRCSGCLKYLANCRCKKAADQS